MAHAKHCTIHKCPNRAMAASINDNFHSQANLGNGKYRYKCDREKVFNIYIVLFIPCAPRIPDPGILKGNGQNHDNH